MPDSSRGISSVGGRWSAGCGSSLVRYSHSYGISTCSWDYQEYFDALRFSKVPSAETLCLSRVETGVRDTVAGTWRKRWKHLDGPAALRPQAASPEMNSPLVSYQEVGGSQKWLVAFLD